MKRLIYLIALLPVALSAQLNPTTHLKPAPDTGYVLISRPPFDRYYPRNLYDYITDSLGITGGGGSTPAAGSVAGAIQYNDGSDNFAADDNFYYSSGVLYLPTTMQIGQNIVHAGDPNTDIFFIDDYLNLRAGGWSMITLDKTGADANLKLTATNLDLKNVSNILDNTGSAGSPGDYLSPDGSGGVEWVAGGGGGAAQTLSWNGANGELSISGGNTVDLDGRYLQSEVDGSVSNEGALRVGAGTSTTSIINSNTAGSTPVTLQAGANVTLSESGNTITIAASGGGGGGSPGGLDGYVQYNNGGAFGGESSMYYDDVNNRLTIENLSVQANLYDGVGSLGTNTEFLTTTGTESRWKTLTNSITGRFLYLNLDGTPIGAGVDLSDADLSDAGSVENGGNSQDLHQTSLTKVTEWTTTPEFSGTGITWTSATDRWTVTTAGKYEITFNICLDNQSTGDACLQFWVYVNGSPAGVPYYATVQDAHYESVTHAVTLSLSSLDYIEIYSARCDSKTATVTMCSGVNGGFFNVKRINY